MEKMLDLVRDIEKVINESSEEQTPRTPHSSKRQKLNKD
jgi:hypothetical protein